MTHKSQIFSGDIVYLKDGLKPEDGECCYDLDTDVLAFVGVPLEIDKVFSCGCFSLVDQNFGLEPKWVTKRKKRGATKMAKDEDDTDITDDDSDSDDNSSEDG